MPLNRQRQARGVLQISDLLLKLRWRVIAVRHLALLVPIGACALAFSTRAFPPRDPNDWSSRKLCHPELDGRVSEDPPGRGEFLEERSWRKETRLWTFGRSGGLVAWAPSARVPIPTPRDRTGSENPAR